MWSCAQQAQPWRGDRSIDGRSVVVHSANRTHRRHTQCVMSSCVHMPTTARRSFRDEATRSVCGDCTCTNQPEICQPKIETADTRARQKRGTPVSARRTHELIPNYSVLNSTTSARQYDRPTDLTRVIRQCAIHARSTRVIACVLACAFCHCVIVSLCLVSTQWCVRVCVRAVIDIAHTCTHYELHSYSHA